MAKIESGLHLLVNHRQKIENKEVEDAFFYMVGHALSLPGWRCTAVQKGFIAAFRYDRSESNPYAFIINQESLLFYLRKPSMKMLGERADGFRNMFDEVSSPRSGEITVRIRNLADAKKLVRYLFD